MREHRIAILSMQDDLHALALQHAMNKYDDVVCHVMETDLLCGSSGLTWSDDICTLPSREGALVDVRDLDLIWLRRFGLPQQVPAEVTNEAHVSIINNDCGAALLGLLLNEFSGTWISHPHATRQAQNKLVQLRVAQSAGFRVPRTLVTQDPAEVRAFCATVGDVVVKTVQGSPRWPLLTTRVQEQHLLEEESIRLAPAIYQEYIPGQQHIRVLCLGKSVYAALIESEELDWRANLDGPIEPIVLESSPANQLVEILRRLGLKMGVFDLKLDDEGQLIWLEVNPQGQFLFVQGLTGLDLVTPSASFLYQEATRAASDNSRGAVSGFRRHDKTRRTSRQP